VSGLGYTWRETIGDYLLRTSGGSTEIPQKLLLWLRNLWSVMHLITSPLEEDSYAGESVTL
jgi:hypothetical protein